jgi:large subunit ribosomal protein L7A
LLEELKGKRKAVGAKQCKKALETGNALLVFIAEDADSHVTGEIEKLCNQSDIKIIKVASMKELGKSCGIDVSAAVACLLK